MHLSIAACVSFSLHQSKTDSSTSCSNKNSFSVCHPHKLSVGKNRRIGENWNFKYNICQWDAHRDCLLADYTIHTIPYRRETSGVGCNKECCRVDEGKLRYLSWLGLRSLNTLKMQSREKCVSYNMDIVVCYSVPSSSSSSFYEGYNIALSSSSAEALQAALTCIILSPGRFGFCVWAGQRGVAGVFFSDLTDCRASIKGASTGS